MRRARRRRLMVPLLVAAALAGLSTPGAPLRAQDAPEEPAMAEAPAQFRLSLSAGGMLWEDRDRTPDDGPLWGLDVERTLASFLSVRLGGAVGTSTLRAGGQSADFTAYLGELVMEGRAAPPALRRAGVLPFATLGVATLTHDPAPDGLPTASQNALAWGAGLEVRPFDRFGLRGEWRRYSVEMENFFDPLDRSSEDRSANRLYVTVFWVP